MTHDLFVRVLGDLEAELVQIAVTELRENTFYATLTLRKGGKTTEVDSRPSDAIALAVRLDTPIYASDDVIASSSIEMDDEPATPRTRSPRSSSSWTRSGREFGSA